MNHTTDRFGIASDNEAQLTTIRAGWRFYERASARDYAQQALEEWVSAVEAVLDLGVEPSALKDFHDCLREALEAAQVEGLESRIRTIMAALTPPALGQAAAMVRALRKRRGEQGEPVLADAEPVAVDLGVGQRSAQHVSAQLRADAA